MIFDYGFVPEVLYEDKTFLYVDYVLLLHYHNLNCVFFFSFSIFTSMDSCIRPLSYHLLKHIFLIEGVDRHFILLLILI